MIWRLIYDKNNTVISLKLIDNASVIDTDLYEFYESNNIDDCIDKINEFNLTYGEGLVSEFINKKIGVINSIKINDYKDNHYDNILKLLKESLNYIETQTILAEDNNIELNYNGTPETSIGGGLRILYAKDEYAAELITDENGDFVTNNDLKPKALTIPIYTPTSSNDENGNEGNITRDDNYLYIKTSSGWKRTNLESF